MEYASPQRLTKTVARSPSLLEPTWKRFQTPHLDPHVPWLVLDADGTILDATRAARHVLEYDANASIDPCFFTHVNGKNLRRVMQDLAMIVCRRKTRSSWLLRLRTGTGRWRWYRASVYSDPTSIDAPRILVRLRRV